ENVRSIRAPRHGVVKHIGEEADLFGVASGNRSDPHIGKRLAARRSEGDPLAVGRENKGADGSEGSAVEDAAREQPLLFRIQIDDAKLVSVSFERERFSVRRESRRRIAGRAVCKLSLLVRCEVIKKNVRRAVSIRHVSHPAAVRRPRDLRFSRRAGGHARGVASIFRGCGEHLAAHYEPDFLAVRRKSQLLYLIREPEVFNRRTGAARPPVLRLNTSGSRIRYRSWLFRRTARKSG